MSIPDRLQLEADFAADLRPVFERQYRRAILSPMALPFGVFAQELAGAMFRSLKRAFQLAGMALAVGNSLLLSAGAFDAQANQWALGQANGLASRIVDTSRQLSAEAVYQAMSGAPANREVKLALALAPIFMADSRIDNIAITETTRAMSAGENAAVLYFPRADEADGERLVAIWETREDERVCSICQPFDGHGIEAWGAEFPEGPPAHPRCRCRRRWIGSSQWTPPRKRAA